MIRPASSTPSAAASLRTRRVSSAAITCAAESASASRADASAGWPIGAAATVRTPWSPCLASPRFISWITLAGRLPAALSPARDPTGQAPAQLGHLSRAAPSGDRAERLRCGSMMTSRTVPAAEDTGTRLDALRTRLVPPMAGSRFWGWAGPLLVTALGAFLRFNRLGVPRAVIFDETYYVPDAYGILRYGVEHNYIANRNALIVKGNPHFFTSGG